MMVTVKLLAHMGSLAGVNELMMDEPTVKRLMRALEARFGDEFKQRLAACKVIVNGRNVVGLKRGRTRLNAGDLVSVLPPLAGG